jgi:uncharacterized protein with HEPN domain
VRSTSAISFFRVFDAYFDIDLDIVWQIITQDLDSLLAEVEKAIRDLET